MPGRAFANFVKNNAGVIGLSAIGNADELTGQGTKLKGVLDTVKDVILLKSGLAGFFVMAISGLKDLAKSTGSLDAALKKMSQTRELTKFFENMGRSAKIARTEVKMLSDFARDKSLRFENVAQAAKTLQIFGRGLLGGVRNLELLNNAAAGTGNTFNQTAQAAAQFTEALNSKTGIPEAIENLREMQLISDKTADSLNELNMNGRGTRQQMLGMVQRDLASHPGAAERERHTPEGIAARIAAAKTTAQEGFGSGFTKGFLGSEERKAEIIENLAGAAPAVGKFAGKVAGLPEKLLEVNPVKKKVEESGFAGWLVDKFLSAPEVAATSPAELNALHKEQAGKKAAFSQAAIEKDLIKRAQRRGLELGELTQRALLRGDTRSLKRIANRRAVEDMFNEYMAAGYSREEAAQKATEHVQRQVQINADQYHTSLNAAAAVSDLARIGGGGGVEMVRGAADVYTQQLNVEKDMKALLEDIKELIANRKDGIE